MTDPLSPTGLERFAEVAAGHVGPETVPGLVALVCSGEQVHVEALGSLSVGGPPVSRSSQFRISSTSKPVTGAAVMALVDEGLVGLDDTVETWLPELADRQVLGRMDGPLDDTVPAARPITVRDLATFTFGFGMVVEMFTAPRPWPVVAAAADLCLGTLGPPNPDKQPDPDTWIAALGSLPLLAHPGHRWLYNTGATVLGVLAERAAGTAFPDVVRTRLLEPLGMGDTAFWASDTSRLATAYAPGPDGLAVWDPPDGQWGHPPALADGAAGLVSTADDLLAFARMFLASGAPALSAGAVAQMTADQLTADQRAGAPDAFLRGRSWGLCQSVITEGARAGSFGWDGGLGTSWLVDPSRDLIVIVLTQRLWQTSRPPAVHDDLQDAAYAALT
ncbi:MAG TPA: serine hydrolase domain-containing protein [Acidimicrobiales bacterium]|nr:serine hydrolase domain-containing protein [Acidimicrobiales bacterium]